MGQQRLVRMVLMCLLGTVGTVGRAVAQVRHSTKETSEGIRSEAPWAR